MRDDLETRLGLPLSRIVFCILHAELRNEGMFAHVCECCLYFICIEQWLTDLALLCNTYGTLDNLNDVLYHYGPESFDKPRVSIIEKSRKDDIGDKEIGRKNVHLASFNGKL